MPDKDGVLTAEETGKLRRWLDEHWKQPWVCPVSGHKAWDIPDRVIYLHGFPPNEMHQAKLTVYPSIAVICKGCGYTMLFNVPIMELGINFPKGDEEKRGEEKKNG